VINKGLARESKDKNEREIIVRVEKDKYATLLKYLLNNEGKFESLKK
jgi:hypothetical protein